MYRNYILNVNDSQYNHPNFFLIKYAFKEFRIFKCLSIGALKHCS